MDESEGNCTIVDPSSMVALNGENSDVVMETSSHEISKTETLRSRILDQVAASNAFFKSQQRGERDLAFQEKWDIAKDILDKDVPLFLQRYARYIAPEDLEYFKQYEHIYEVAFYLKENQKYHNKRNVRIKNRRYGALQQFIKEGKYFSEEEMKTRNPLLYEQMIGQFQTEDEKRAMHEKELSEMTFSGFLMSQMNKAEDQYHHQQQKDEEDSMWEEGDSDEEESEIDENEATSITEPERNMLKAEFINIMYESFLAGKDKDFDYSTVDDNTDYDLVDMEQQDEEEKYFDSEEPEYAGDLDFADVT